jgi:hypothetical protein
MTVQNDITVGKSKDPLVASYAPDFGCLPIEHIATWADGSVSRLVVDQISQNDPDTALFNVPGTYSEVKPSDMARLRMSRRGMSETAIAARVAKLARADAMYSSHRPN